MGRRYFATASGLSGLASTGVNVYDDIVYFPGSPELHVVRHKRSDGLFKLTGDCYLYLKPLHRLVTGERFSVWEIWDGVESVSSALPEVKYCLK